MLRDYAYTENWRLLDPAIEQFIDLPPQLSLIGFTELTPDSFLWKFHDGTTIYYLYAEDFVESLDQVIKTIEDFWPQPITLTFIPVKRQVAFEDSQPNQTAIIYQPPQNEYEFAKYASQSGYDFVFLLKSDEKLV